MTRSFGLRTEILMTLSLLLGAALLFGGLVMLRYMQSSLLEERISQLDAISHQLVENIPWNSSALSEKITALIPDSSDCRFWRLYDTNLDPLAQWSLDNTGQKSFFPSAVLFQARASRTAQRSVFFPVVLNFLDRSLPNAQILVPIFKQKRFVGAIELFFSLEDIRSKLWHSQKLVLVYTLLYGLVLVGTGYLLLSRNIIRPARELVRATNAVEQGNLKNRLVVSGPSEIGQLANAYNRMVDALEKSKEETDRHILSLKQSNIDLERAKNELIHKEKMALVGQLTAGLAHELGNPLSAVIGYLELLKVRLAQSGDKDLVERSLTETNRIDFLVRELLDFSRPGTQKLLDDVNLAEEMNGCVHLLQNQGVLSTVNISNRLPELLPEVRINKQKLQQVFVNLLLNATYACGDGGNITLTAGFDDSATWISVRDDGCGIADDELLRIFDPFFTTKEPGEGTGLGLAMCQRIVEEVHGKITVSTKLKCGSDFKVVFQRIV